ncbi:type II toxin-antitoxin system RelE/ParE family toxin [Candidatus Halobeggiatoa sp. HSG11]|nr:type II toxin-antitoxin system RelE/ParE family toxin [Candidatus Halobeggiatoa sp. HSG11]
MANYEIFTTNEFDKKLSKLNKREQQLINKSLIEKLIPQLQQEPHFGTGIKKLINWKPDTWRYRIGGYRIFYTINDNDMEVDLVTIHKRKDAY